MATWPAYITRRSALKNALLFCLLLMAAKAYPQALSGTYTIGGTSANYSSFSAAAGDLITNGISGPVVFKVAPGNYNDTMTIPAIKGSSATNTITFSGAGIATTGGTRLYYSLTKTGTSIINIKGASYITLDHITVENTSTASSIYADYPAAIRTGYDTATTISNCKIKVAVSNSTLYNVVGIHFFNSYKATVINSYVGGGLFGILNEGATNSASVTYGSALIKNSRFTGAYYNHIYGYGYPYGLSNNVYEGNSFDSSNSPYISALQLTYENGATVRNNVTDGNVASYLPIEIDYPNAGSNNVPFMVYNNMIGNFIYQGIYVDAYSIANTNTYILHNTIDEENNTPSYLIYAYYSASGGLTIEDNILSANTSAIPLYLYTPLSPSKIMIDGNDYYNTGGAALINYNKGSYTSIAAFRGAISSLGWSVYDNNVKPNYKSKRDLHLDQTKPNPSGVYAGITVDIDGDQRCSTYPTSGADESTYGSGAPVVKFYLPATIYPNSPTYVYQIAKAGEPKRHSWYLNGVHISDSIVLFTNKFISGTNTLKLVTSTCFGSDSFEQTFSVSAPTSVPVTDFISDRNFIHTNDVVTMEDLSSNGPTKWQWVITPDSTLVGGIKTAALKYVYGNNFWQNPQIKFIIPGKYRVCLTASNGVGKGNTLCKKDYIVVTPATNMGSVTVVHDASGYLYDNGGPNGDYNYDSKLETMVIDPCADSVYLTFSQFDLYCGYDYLRIYEGRNNQGKNISGSCTTTGSYDSYGPGFTGGKAFPSCIFQCMPNTVTPDTFRAKGQMYIEMRCYAAFQSAGFAAYWWSKPKSGGYTRPKASFTSSARNDSACVNGLVTFTNTTKTDPSDPPTFLWDLDGDLSTFECIGNCATAAYTYYLQGGLNVTLIATGCGGSDTAVMPLFVYNPSTPKTVIAADNTNPTTTDVVYFSAPIAQCVEKYKWTITPANNPKGKVTFANGTTAASAGPQVTFSDTGYYNVMLAVSNMGGTQKDSLLDSNFIHVRPAYCTPSVNKLNKDIGISKISFNTLSKSTSQAATDYSTFVNIPSLATTVAKNVTYSLSISRNSAGLSNSINRTIYIDWNQDGYFTGKGETVLSDSDSYMPDVTVSVKVPAYAKTGATVMRVAVNRGDYSNKPCGANEYGEYQDYRIYVMPYNVPPVITLKGKNGTADTIFTEEGQGFKEPGYSASSYLYGNLTAQVKVTSRQYGSLDPNDTFNLMKQGVYYFYYNVTDSSGNKAVTAYRIVKVTPDRSGPEIVVEKPDTVLIEVTAAPMHTQPVPMVISSYDLVDGGPFKVTIDSGNIKTNVLGTYIVTYSSADKHGNKSTVYRVIKVVDTIKPLLSLIGQPSTETEVHYAYNDSFVQFSDNYYSNTDLAALLVKTSDVDTSKTGTYHVSYSLADPSGNKAATVIRTVKVIDTIKPVIILNPRVNDSVEVLTKYTDPGYTVTDNYDKKANIKVTVSGTFYAAFPSGKIPDKLGAYTIIYTATDQAGNTASVTRTVKVTDHTAPDIHLTGAINVSVCRWFRYLDAGYTVSDNFDSVQYLKIDTLGNFFKAGGTTIQNYLFLYYTATDRSGNIGHSENRIIEVKPADDASCASGISNSENDNAALRVYPNPAAGIFNINLAIAGREEITIEVCDVMGRSLFKVFSGSVSQEMTRTVDMGNYASGIYMLKLTSASRSITRRIEIMR